MINLIIGLFLILMAIANGYASGFFIDEDPAKGILFGLCALLIGLVGVMNVLTSGVHL